VLQPWMHERLVAPISAGYVWKPEQGTQILVLDKDDLSKRRVYELPAFSFFHMGDAWEDKEGTIRFDICTSPNPDFGVQGAVDMMQGKAPKGGADTDLTLVTLRADGKAWMAASGLVVEFPKTDPRYAGRTRSFSACLGGSAVHPLFQGVAVCDWTRGKTERYDLGPRQIMEEVVFTPRPGGTAEFDGWLVGTSINLDAKATELHVFDARRVAAGPICTWRAEVALPATLHGAFVRKT